MRRPIVIELALFADSVNDAVLLGNLLRNQGQAVRAESVETLGQLRTLLKDGRVDLVILDLELGDPSPAEVLALIQELTPEVGLVVRGEVSAQQQVALLQAGVRAILPAVVDAHLAQIILREHEVVSWRRQIRRYRQMLQESERLSRLLMDSSRDAIAYIADGVHVYANPIYVRLFGFDTFEDIEGSTLLDRVATSSQELARELLQRYQRGQTMEGLVELDFQRIDHSQFTGSINIAPASMNGERCLQIIIHSQGDTEALKKQLEMLNQRDMLTGLFNRQYFEERLGHTLDLVQKTGESRGLMILQIDQVEALRNRIGVSGVDLLVIELGKKLEQIFDPEREILARYGSHSFSVVSQRTNRDQLLALASEVLAFVRQQMFSHNDLTISYTGSIGITYIDRATRALGELYNRAERAMLQAESEGGNRAVFYQASAAEQSQAEQDEEWGRRIREALKQNRFRMVYQPIIHLQGDLSRQRYEAFLRLVDESGEQVNPEKFLPSAERTDLARGIDRWVMLNAIKALEQAQREGKPAQLFVKLSARSVTDPEFTGWLRERVTARKLGEHALAVELRQSVVADHLREAKDLIKSLRQIGIPVLIEDFGRGSNPFLLLNHIEPDFIRIDRSFLSKQPLNEEAYGEIKHIVDGCREAKVAVVIPNVESAQMLQKLWVIGADYVQGNFIQQAGEGLNFNFGSMG